MMRSGVLATCLLVAAMVTSAAPVLQAQEAPSAPPPSEESAPPPVADDTTPPPVTEGEAPPDLADDNAPPPMTEGEAPPPMADDNAPPPMDLPNDNPPPPIDGPADVPPAFIPADSGRPFLSRFGAVEIGLMAASLAAGWVISGAIAVASAFIFSSFVLGRAAFDLPLIGLQVATAPTQITQGAGLFTGLNGAILAGGLFFSVLGGAVLSALATVGINLLSPDWETAIGSVVASGVLGGAAVLVIGATAFVASLALPVPLVWLIALGAAGFAGIVIPPVVIVAAQVISKQPRLVPGGLLAAILSLFPINPLNRPPAPNP